MRLAKRTSPPLLALIALAIGAAGCGGEGGHSASDTTQAQAEANTKAEAHNEEVRREYGERQQVEIPTEEEKEAKKSAADFYVILGEDKAEGDPNRTTIDAGSFCDLMGGKAQVQTIHYAKVSSGIAQKWDCESAVDLLVLRSKREGGFRDVRHARVIGVNAVAGRATATVRFGKDGTVTSMPLVREGGEWRLAAMPAVQGQP